MRSRYLGTAIGSRPSSRRRPRAVWILPPFVLLGIVAAAFVSCHGLAPEYRWWEALRVEISGNRVLLPSEIQQDACLGPRAPWLLLDAAAVRARLMRDPWIATAHVSRG